MVQIYVVEAVRAVVVIGCVVLIAFALCVLIGPT